MVPLSVLFRFSLYLCLLLSTVSLGYAELVPLPETGPFFLLVAGLLLWAARLEHRLKLSIRTSNWLGVAIILTFGTWVVVSYKTNFKAAVQEIADLEFARWLLPHGGPLLSALLVVKMLRPKGLRDYWMLHLLGLVQMVLASVLAMSNKLDRDAPWFPLLLLAYLLSFVWVLLNFTLYYDGVPDRLTILPTPQGGWRRGVPPQETLLRPRPRSVLGWFSAALVLGLTLFFIVPRGGDVLAGAAARPTESMTGFKPSVDLTTEGPLTVSEERVFHVTAVNHLGQTVPLLDEYRWRGVVCSEYKDGFWSSATRDILALNTRDRTGAEVFRTAALPPSGHLRLTYTLDVRRVRTAGEVKQPEMGNANPGQTTIFLMEHTRLRSVTEPVPLRYPRVRIPDDAPRGDRPPPLNPFATGPLPPGVGFNYSWLHNTIFAMLPPLRPPRDLYYEQEIALTDVNVPEWDQVFGFGPREDASVFRAYAFERDSALLLQLSPALQKSGRLKRFGDEILRQAGVPADAPARVKAQALERGLNQNPAFSYSSFRRRVALDLDPNEDFLLNVRSGHCERFASALALLLRAQGIPARLVIGFRGGDWNNVARCIEVRELHAHAWVEAAVELERLPDGRPRRIRWRTLDPTPTNEELANRDVSFLAQNLSFAKMLWEFFILDFSGDMQRRQFLTRFDVLGIQAFAEWIASLGWLGVLLLIGLFLVSAALAISLVYLFRELRERWRLRRTLARWQAGLVPFYQRLLAWLARRRLVPVPAQTPREFARQAGQSLRQDPAAAPLAEAPVAIVDHYYAVRYGQVPLADEAPAAEAKLEQLEKLR
jgi:transglutaminase-like putative cysteine protease/uncharacterized membrane protein YecN with MAPEG domain